MEKWLKTFEPAGLFLGTIIGTIIIAATLNWLFRRFIQRSTLIIRNDPTNYVFLRHAITGLVYCVGFGWAIYNLPDMRAIANSLLAGAGILAVAVGFASQHALGNIISGVFIVVFKPFRVNDRLRFQSGLGGVVEDITLRHVVIRDFENRRIIIPNSKISEEVIVNADFGEDKICKWVEAAISYESDHQLAKAIMREEAEAHPLCLDNRKPEDIEQGEPIVQVRLIALEENGARLRAYVWAKDSAEAFSMGCDLMEKYKERFTAAGIAFAYPKRVMIYPGDKDDATMPK
ncbi:mechanosensitive ion channel family protein [Phaeodactylibacter luteus]|uniref:Mechanosensitive ion channel family protein n=1 Tax=Phaeodactylibacter luteus TaxID=1564516 RepID=A0A5C6S5Y7_9BACT|nr:mechanosensitive ion channel family protein [Phaeodactylibacter luteus]TXB70258.1 mechanosensitive ion channel family protein [Phaeodactylibacter luteus]